MKYVVAALVIGVLAGMLLLRRRGASRGAARRDPGREKK
jgi:hypothetical protein